MNKQEPNTETIALHHNILRSFVNSTNQSLYALIEQSRHLTTDSRVSLAWDGVLSSLRTVSDAIYISEKEAIKRAIDFENALSQDVVEPQE